MKRGKRSALIAISLFCSIFVYSERCRAQDEPFFEYAPADPATEVWGEAAPAEYGETSGESAATGPEDDSSSTGSPSTDPSADDDAMDDSTDACLPQPCVYEYIGFEWVEKPVWLPMPNEPPFLDSYIYNCHCKYKNVEAQSCPSGTTESCEDEKTRDAFEVGWNFPVEHAPVHTQAMWAAMCPELCKSKPQKPCGNELTEGETEVTGVGILEPEEGDNTPTDYYCSEGSGPGNPNLQYESPVSVQARSAGSSRTATSYDWFWCVCHYRICGAARECIQDGTTSCTDCCRKKGVDKPDCFAMCKASKQLACECAQAYSSTNQCASCCIDKLNNAKACQGANVSQADCINSCDKLRTVPGIKNESCSKLSS